MKLAFAVTVLAAFIFSLGRTISLGRRFLLFIKEKQSNVYETIQPPHSPRDILAGNPGVMQALIYTERYLLSKKIPQDPELTTMQRKFRRSILATTLFTGIWILYATMGLRFL